MGLRMAACVSTCLAALVAQSPDQVGDFPGRPPIASPMTFHGPGGDIKWAMDSSLPPKGPVASIVCEEFRPMVRGQTQSPTLWETVTTEFDDQQRTVNQKSKRETYETRITNTYQGLHLVAQKNTFTENGKLNRENSSSWTYDAKGRLIEFRHLGGTMLQDHYANFQYDQQGRLISVDRREGADEKLRTRMEYKYSEDTRTVEEVMYRNGERLHWQLLTFDSQGRIVQEEFRSMMTATKQLDRLSKVRFSYDSKGRPVEQVADVSETDENLGMQGGTTTVVYDDTTRTQEFSLTKGIVTLKSTIWRDESGAIVGSASGIKGGNAGRVEVECSRDSHGNWTECRECATRKEKRELERQWRRRITYR